MSEYPIKCSCDGLLLYDKRLLIGMTRYGHLHMTNIYSSLWKFETATTLLKFLSWSMPECFTLSVTRSGCETRSQTKSRRQNRNHSLVSDKMLCKS